MGCMGINEAGIENKPQLSPKPTGNIQEPGKWWRGQPGKTQQDRAKEVTKCGRSGDESPSKQGRGPRAEVLTESNCPFLWDSGLQTLWKPHVQSPERRHQPGLGL